jgi:hypothetical protein
LKELRLDRVQVDEIWSYIKNNHDPQAGIMPKR